MDGEIVAAAQEERFSRKKHDASFPAKAIEYCLKEAGLTPGELDLVGFYDKPLMKFDRLLETYLAYAPRGFSSFVKAMPVWLREKLHLPGQMTRGLDGAYRKRFIFTEHHESHAASAFFPSPFREAAILTVDGVGEWATATFGTGTDNRIRLTHELRFPPFPRASLLRLHLFLRVPGELGRVQAHGPGALRRASIRGPDSPADDRPEGGRLLPHGHVLFQLLPGPDHDLPQVRSPLRRTAPGA